MPSAVMCPIHSLQHPQAHDSPPSRPAAKLPDPMITIPTAPPLNGRDPNTTLDQHTAAEHREEDGDEPLAGSTTGLSIFSDVTRPLRHLSVDQLHAPADDAEVIRVRLAKPRPLDVDTTSLIARRYSSRGYPAPRPLIDRNVFTFAAYDNGHLAGTVSMRFDSPSGLMAEQLYPEQIAGLRTRDLRLCEFTRLALDEQAMSKEVLGSLFHSCYLYAHVVRGLTHAVIEVNPRHVAFYRRVLHFKVAGEERHNRRVDAPAVLLSLDFSVIARELDLFFANPDWRNQSKSFFVHWFSPEDAAGIIGRLRREHAAGRMAA